MTPAEYIEKALRTENTPKFVDDRIAMSESHYASSLIHASLGMQTECAEFADMLKKHLIYGKEIDEVNLQEELGDVLWYIALAAHTLGVSFEGLFAQNIAKLQKRFPEKFTQDAALNRDLEAERKALEDGNAKTRR